jgi:hypothetical protein
MICGIAWKEVLGGGVVELEHGKVASMAAL